MAKPTIVTVDDDESVSTAIARDLRTRYGDDYRVVRATSGAGGLDVLRRLARRGQPVALVAADERMPGMTGIQMLSQVREYAPTAKLLLLTAYADMDAAIAGINDIGLDQFLLKPWDPPQERLYPAVDELLDDWLRANPDHTSDIRVVGHRWSDRTHDIKTFLARNHIPYHWYDVEDDADEAARLLGLGGAAVADVPVVLTPEGVTLRSPSTYDLATALGLRTQAEQPVYDLAIVGAGPAGLAAAVYAASEGLSTVVIEGEAPGGQAGQSAAIENYLGFPRGLTGGDLAQRAIAQVGRFGAELVVARDVVGLERRGPVRALTLAGGGSVEARAIVVATGMSYRLLPAKGVPDLTGRGLYYGVGAGEASQCEGDVVHVVGAANSAGQAVLNLARYAKRVVVLARGTSLDDSMSRYLVERIEAAPNVEVRYRAEVLEVKGEGHVESLVIGDRDTGDREVVASSWLFVFIGATPHTDWLGGEVVRDDEGYLLTGRWLQRDEESRGWPLARAPYALETSVPGVFAAGDARHDSMKRVASAVGEGAMAVALVHRYLAAT
ncbi:response regulator [Mumia zhuanghuii]|uniref:Response regulator n=1 Tax=Mumia zhuanghuii TaxID=2585211 RepID=A0A5Q6RP24_9ACTN|nr:MULTISPECIES: FAD-dependent oxidoreductase [Mumia]KAA1419757.1 response regulator [Mumia zhuanghuii]